MLLDRQRTLLTVLASLTFAATLAITVLAAREVRIKTAQIATAQDTVSAVTNFRYLSMEVALYGEARAHKQWISRFANFERAMSSHRYSGVMENQLLAREKYNLKALNRLFLQIDMSPAGGTEAGRKRTSVIVSALFLTAQEMLDDAFELIRLNQRALEASQRRATVSALASLALLVLLIAFISMVIKRRVLQPVGALQRMTEQVIKGNLDLRLNLAESNEIGSLGRSFDAMTLQLQQSRQEMASKSEQLYRTQEALQRFIDYTPALVTYWDKELRNHFANKAYLDWFGQSPQQIRGRHIEELIGAERYAELAPHLRRVLDGERVVFEKRLTLDSGEVRDALFSYVPDIQDGQVRGMYGFVSDISELKRAEAGKELALQQLQGVVDAAHDFSIIQTDLHGLIALFSPGAERMLGYRAAEVLGQPLLSLLYLADEVRWRAEVLSKKYGRSVAGLDVFIGDARNDGSEAHDWTFVRKDGSTLPVNQNVTAVRDRQGRIVGYLGIARDIRAEREVRRVLAEARDQAEQASVAKGQFLANMSHEIRTPMNAVLGMLELLQHTPLSALQRDYAVKSDAAARALLELLNDILDFSHVEAGKLELERQPFSLAVVMADLSPILASLVGSKDVELIFDMAPDLPALLLGDATRLRQVLINLASNAIKFTERGHVIISLARAAGDGGLDAIAFAVEDTGIGIAPDQQASIFERFTQAEASTARRFGGTGLGLAISARLVQLMGGELAVRSEPGQGSRFSFTARFSRTPPVAAAALAPVAPLRVLLVEAHERARHNLVQLGAGLGWQMLDAASGEEALAVLDAAGASGFDAVVLDWSMPRMDGWELARRMRRVAPSTPIVIMVSAANRAALAARLAGEAALVNGFLTKPATPAMLRDALAGASAAPLQPPPLALPASAARLGGVRVLVVDDIAMNRQIARGLLEHDGATVDEADGGVAALAMSAAHDYDAILMDVQMPDMDGYACTRAMRQRAGARIPVIAMTANVMASDREACLAAGMDDHVGKPIEIATLAAVLLRHCAAPAVPAVPLVPVVPVVPAVPALAGTDADPVQPKMTLRPGSAIDCELALARLGGNRELFAALAATYVSEAASFMEQLPATAAADLPNLLHTFKSAAGIVGATELHNYAGELERSLRHGGAVIDTPAMLQRLHELVECSLTDLAQAVTTMA